MRNHPQPDSVAWDDDKKEILKEAGMLAWYPAIGWKEVEGAANGVVEPFFVADAMCYSQRGLGKWNEALAPMGIDGPSAALAAV